MKIRASWILVLFLSSISSLELIAEDSPRAIDSNTIVTELRSQIQKSEILNDVTINSVAISEEEQFLLITPKGALKLEAQRQPFEKLVVSVLEKLGKEKNLDLRPTFTEMPVARPSIAELNQYLLGVMSGTKSLSFTQLDKLYYSTEGDDIWAIYDATIAFPFQEDLIVRSLNSYFDDVFGPSESIPGKPKAKRGVIAVDVPDADILVDAFQVRTITKFELGSVLICGGSYDNVDGSDTLVLDAKSATPEQVSVAIGEFNAIIDSTYGTDWPRVYPTGFRISGSVSGLALDYRSQGISYYYQGCYLEAKTSFRHAIADSPQDLISRYWHILCNLQIGEFDLAYEQMQELVRVQNDSYNSSGNYISVLKSLERIQGPIRRHLHCMENQAKLECKFAMRSE